MLFNSVQIRLKNDNEIIRLNVKSKTWTHPQFADTLAVWHIFLKLSWDREKVGPISDQTSAPWHTRMHMSHSGVETWPQCIIFSFISESIYGCRRKWEKSSVNHDLPASLVQNIEWKRRDSCKWLDEDDSCEVEMKSKKHFFRLSGLFHCTLLVEFQEERLFFFFAKKYVFPFDY